MPAPSTEPTGSRAPGAAVRSSAPEHAAGPRAPGEPHRPEDLLARVGALEAIERRRRRRRAWLTAGGIAALAGAIGLAAWISRPAPAPDADGTPAAVVFVDVAGWYQRTPNEVAALTPFDLTLDGLPAGLPLAFGAWRGEPRAHDPAVDTWFRDPDVVVERTYRRADGELVWLSAFGSRGDKSFHLFEHTPDTCYPLGGWNIDALGLARLSRGPRPFTVNHGEATGADGELVFLYWYLWDSPARDAERGVLSMRLAAPVRRDKATTFAMLTDDFLAELFPRTLAWSRF